MAGGREKRVEKRVKVALSALVTHPGTGERTVCMIRDASPHGCRLVSSEVHSFPERIFLRMPGIKASIEGLIMWRTRREAGISFVSTSDGMSAAQPDA